VRLLAVRNPLAGCLPKDYLHANSDWTNRSKTFVTLLWEAVKIMLYPRSNRLSQEKRLRLFQVAAEEFATFGFARASLNRIIGELGMSKSSFYHYFENKTDLFKQTLNQALDPFNAAQMTFDLAALTRDTFWTAMQQMTREMTEMLNASPEMVLVGRMFYRSYDDPSEQALTKNIMAVSVAWLASLIERGQVLGLLRKDLPESFVLDLLMAMGMAMDRWVLGHWEDLSDDARLLLNDQAFDLFRRVLEKTKDSVE